MQLLNATCVDSALQRIESMSMQAAMTGSKQHAVLNETMDRLESMAMAQAMAVAKFQKDMNGRMEMTEGMLMSQSHVAAKAQKSIDDRAHTCFALRVVPSEHVPLSSANMLFIVACVR